MRKIDQCGIRIMAGEAVKPPKPGNDNWLLAPSWQTPAEVLQLIRGWKRKIQRDLARDQQLWACPEHRLTRYIRYEMYKCALWHYYGIR